MLATVGALRQGRVPGAAGTRHRREPERSRSPFVDGVRQVVVRCGLDAVGLASGRRQWGLSVDAAWRQVSADRSHVSLPAALHSVALFEPTGPLVAGNRGALEFADLLKRTPEAFKYLLGTSETGRVALDSFILRLDEVLLASANEKQLSVFKDKDVADFGSFKGRIELVRVPFLRRWSLEKQIYDQQVTRATAGKHVAPHATGVAATWGV